MQFVLKGFKKRPPRPKKAVKKPKKRVKKPGSRGGKFWIDAKGTVRYDDKPEGYDPKNPKGHFKWLLRLRIPGHVKPQYVYPNAHDHDEHGNLTTDIRDIIQRELFGSWWFDEDKKFHQKKGILVEYRPRVDGQEIVVDTIRRVPGFISYDFRDDSIADVFGGDLPADARRYQLGVSEAARYEPGKGGSRATADVPPIEDLTNLRSVPAPADATTLAVDTPLEEGEDAVALAAAYLAVTLGKEKGEEKLPPQRRRIKPLPAWATLKYKQGDPAELQRQLSRDGQGKPVSALLTLGLWDANTHYARAEKQLINEWQSEIRYHAREYAKRGYDTEEYQLAALLDTEAEKKGAEKGDLGDTLIGSFRRDLEQTAYKVLLEEAKQYKATDDPRNRFDTYVRNKIMNAMSEQSKARAAEMGGKTVSDEVEESTRYQNAPQHDLSPQEYWELKHLGSSSRKLIRGALKQHRLSDAERMTFLARHWLEDTVFESPSTEDEQAYHEARFKQMKKMGGPRALDTTPRQGRSASDWRRPWVGPGSVSERLADVKVKFKGTMTPFKKLSPQLQKYHLNKWYTRAERYVQLHFKDLDGRLTPQGEQVRRYLQLETKLANTNRRILGAPTLPVSKVRPAPPAHSEASIRERVPHVAFWTGPESNQQLAAKLNLRTQYLEAFKTPHVEQPKMFERTAKQAESYYNKVQHAQSLSAAKLTSSLKAAKRKASFARNVGRWAIDTKTNAASWQEKDGIEAYHKAAVAAVQATDDVGRMKAVKEFRRIGKRVKKTVPGMVDAYEQRLVSDAPAFTADDLAHWRSQQHGAAQAAQNEVYVLEFVRGSKAAKSTIEDLHKAFGDYDFALSRLRAVML